MRDRTPRTAATQPAGPHVLRGGSAATKRWVRRSSLNRRAPEESSNTRIACTLPRTRGARRVVRARCDARCRRRPRNRCCNSRCSSHDSSPPTGCSRNSCQLAQNVQHASDDEHDVLSATRRAHCCCRCRCRCRCCRTSRCTARHRSHTCNPTTCSTRRIASCDALSPQFADARRVDVRAAVERGY